MGSKRHLRLITSMVLAMALTVTSMVSPAMAYAKQEELNLLSSYGQNQSDKSKTVSGEVYKSNPGAAKEGNGKKSTELATNRFIIKYKDGKDRDKVADSLKDKLSKTKKLRDGRNKNIQTVTTKDKLTHSELLNEIKKRRPDAVIEYIQPDYEIQLSSNDPYFSSQWGVYNPTSTSVAQGVNEAQTTTSIDAGVVEAWKYSQGAGVTVAVIDTGMDITHEDLAANIWVNTKEIPGNGADDDGNGYIDDRQGWDFTEDSPIVHRQDLAYDEQHGTSIGGIIAAVKDNGKGITGVAPQAKVMPLKAFKNGVAYTSDIIEAIAYAEMMGVKVVNCSWGTTVDNPALREAIEGSNMLFVCAAGNNGVNIDVNPVYPAAYASSNIITVGSINKSGALSSFSNYGVNSVDVAAPGEDICSTLPGNTYGNMNGTSMAAPFVSGETALLLGKYGGADMLGIREKIISSSDSMNSLIGKVYQGYKVSSSRAVNGLTSNGINNGNVNQAGTVTGAVYGDGFQLFTLGGNPNIMGGSTEIGYLDRAAYKENTDIIDIVHPKIGNIVKAVRLNGGAGVPLIVAEPLALKKGTNYILEFDCWSDADNVEFNFDFCPLGLPIKYPKAMKAVHRYQWVINSPSDDMGNASFRFYNDRMIPNPANIYITNIQLYEQIHNEDNVMRGSTEVGYLDRAVYRENADIIDVAYPNIGNIVKAVRLNGGTRVPLVVAEPLALMKGTDYILEFDYWSDADNIEFSVDFCPLGLPISYPKAMRTVQHYKWVINSLSSDMNSASLRLYNDRMIPNPANIYITNLQMYESIDSIRNTMGGSTEIGYLDRPVYKENTDIVNTVHPKSGNMVRTVRLNGGTNVPLIVAEPLVLKKGTDYILEFDCWADADNVEFNFDFCPLGLPINYPKAMRTLRHYRWVINSSSADMGNASFRFYNDRMIPNPANIYITNIQMYEAIYSPHNKVGGNNEIGLFECAEKSGVGLIDTVNPQMSYTVRAIRLNGGANQPTINTSPIDLKTNTNYVVEFDYWSDIDNVQFNTGLVPDDLPQATATAKRQILHFKRVINSSSANMHNASLRFFCDTAIQNPSNIYITNIQLYEEVSRSPIDTFTNPPAFPSGDVLRLQSSNSNSGAQNYYSYIKFSNTQYIFQPGDYIEYDVKLSNPVAAAGGIDILTTDGKILREMNWADQNGIHATWGDMSQQAADAWYHRKISIPLGAIGKSASHWDLVGENDIPGANYTALYDNIVITNGYGIEKKVIFKSRTDYNAGALDYEGYVNSTLSIADTYGNIPALPSGEVLSLQVSNGNNGAQNYNSYVKFSSPSDNIVFQEGDYIEYDVKLLSPAVYAGGIEIQTKDGLILREMNWVDQNGIHATWGDISQKANNIWYHRKIRIPAGAVGKTISHLDLVGENDIPGLSYIALYDNIVITDGYGAEKKVIFKSQGDSYIISLDYQTCATSALKIVNINGISYEYNANNQLIEIRQKGNPSYKFYYDSNGNLIKKTKIK